MRSATCTQCGFVGRWLVDIFSRPWFKPNRHDDGIVDICEGCWNA